MDDVNIWFLAVLLSKAYEIKQEILCAGIFKDDKPASLPERSYDPSFKGHEKLEREEDDEENVC